MSFSVILPTLNEKGHILNLIYEISKTFENRNTQYEIILVDDSSTDGTFEIVENEKKARYPEESVLEVWRYLESSEYGITDMTKEEILKEILEDWEDLSKSETDESLNQDRGRWIQEGRDIFGEDDAHDEIEADLHTIVIQLEQIRRFGKIIYRKE